MTQSSVERNQLPHHSEPAVASVGSDCSHAHVGAELQQAAVTLGHGRAYQKLSSSE